MVLQIADASMDRWRTNYVLLYMYYYSIMSIFEFICGTVVFR